MQRILGEIVVLVLAALISVAVLTPAVQVVASGVLPGPRDTAFLILGMVYGMVAPIGYFLAEVWWRRAVALIAAAIAATAIGVAAYLFETRQSEAGLLLLAALLAALSALALLLAALRRRRQAAVARIEDEAVAAAIAVTEAARRASGLRTEASQTVALTEHLALASIWTAAREADGGDDAMARIDAALDIPQADFAANPVIPAAPLAAWLVGEIRRRLRPTRRGVIPGGALSRPAAGEGALFQPL